MPFLNCFHTTRQVNLVIFSDKRIQPLQTHKIAQTKLRICWGRIQPQHLFSYRIRIYKHHDPTNPIEIDVEDTGTNTMGMCYTASGLQPNILYRVFVNVLDPEKSPSLFVFTTLQRTRE